MPACAYSTQSLVVEEYMMLRQYSGRLQYMTHRSHGNSRRDFRRGSRLVPHGAWAAALVAPGSLLRKAVEVGALAEEPERVEPKEHHRKDPEAEGQRGEERQHFHGLVDPEHARVGPLGIRAPAGPG